MRKAHTKKLRTELIAELIQDLDINPNRNSELI